ncbi:Uma2 family endonuclease [Syntrophomonas palmitatica]|uniref:Uma2 family endonuclease n=1 Tax=Syntrophomonas palmitatica TaxID=402877 RepID=UPI0006D248BC|nr:Uma2 family endonuclease [Syntrophomonas palmitatica]
MSMSAPRPGRKYTYGDYLKWPDEERWEIIDGVPYEMSPAPSTEHQRVSTQLLGQLIPFAANKPCNIFHAPFDVRLPWGNEKDEEIDTVVQPDICVICDPAKIDARGCKGAPDLVIEILSHATAKKDLSEKYNLYEKCGVREYWVVFPKEKVLDVYHLNDNGIYDKTGTYFDSDIMECELFPGLAIKLEDVFAGI